MGVLGSIYRLAMGVTRGGVLPPERRREAERLLADEVVKGYRPAGALSGWLDAGASTPSMARFFEDIEAMIAHPRVSSAMGYYKAGLASAEFTLEDASSGEVGRFAAEEVARFWRRHRAAVQESYEYGRGGCEAVYARSPDGLLRLAELRPFLPTDCRVLTTEGRYAGLRVRSARISADLWGPRPGLPAKALWHAHRKRFHRFYGFPQLYPAWRPWRRLAGRDGAEEVIDGGVYRFAFQPPLGRFPPEDEAQRDGSFKSNRDKMRELLENIKAGGVVALSSRTDENGQYVWSVEWPQGALQVEGLIAYCSSLEAAVSLGVGVPPELLEASEVGSGYSGRAIPLEAFLVQQQHNADELLESIWGQVVAPLLHWNFGPQAWASVRIKNLLETRSQGIAQAQSGAEPAGGAAGSEDTAVGGGAASGGRGVTWTRFKGRDGRQGWLSSHGLVRYQAEHPQHALDGGGA